MNFSKPINIILIGSLLIGLLVMSLLVIINVISDANLNSLYFIILPILTSIISFFVFSILIEKFINQKIKLIYRIISTKKLTKSEDVKINDDVLAKITKDTSDWATQQKNQIEQLQKQAEFRKEFLGNLAHELKTPVFSIQGYILTLLEGGLEDENVNRKFLERALTGVDRISHVLEDLDNISRYEYERYQLSIKEFDITKLVRDIFDTLSPTSIENNVKLKTNKAYEPIKVLADEGKIGQVLINLLSNAISYSKEEGEVEVRFHNIDKKTLLVEVADNGLGIDAKHLPRLFERFYRVDKSRARNIGGSGLGLSIVKHIVEAHNQTINVRSTEGKGSTFSFTLELK